MSSILSRSPSRLAVLPVIALSLVVVACGGSSSDTLESLPPIRTTTSTSTTTTTIDPRPRVYVVQPGDNVNDIAAAYGVTAARVIQLNGLSENGAIRPGQELRIPSRVVADVYVVQAGDSVTGIAQLFNVTAASIIELNGLPENGGIVPGQELKIPFEVVDVTLPALPDAP